MSGTRTVTLDGLSSLGEPGQVPTEVQVFAPGRTETTKGPMVWTERSARSVLGRMAALGRDKLNWDYGHGQLGAVQTSETSASAGWFEVEASVEAGLWARNIEWTPRAQRGLGEKEWRYFSPAVIVDAETDEILEIINIALTNIPATIGQKPLVASIDTPDEGPNPKDSDMDATLVKLLGAMQAQDAEAAEAKFVALSTECDGLKAERQELLSATKDLQEKLTEAEGKLEAVAKDQAQRELSAFVDELCKAKKLQPSLRKWALSQSLESLKDYAEGATPAMEEGAVEAPSNDNTIRTLSDSEKAILKATGVSEESYIKARGAHIGGK